MLYKSTRNSELRRSASSVIAQGISSEGGLFVPETLPNLHKDFSELQGMSYCRLAEKIFAQFLTDFSEEEIRDCVEKAYSPEKFGGGEPIWLAPLTKTGENKYLLELWHGPTCAFKDMALQILPHFLTTSLKKTAPGKKAVILVATSGDTGKAALEGFRDVEDTEIVVFYPQSGVSTMQQRQMETQEGKNVSVCAVEGNFDDTQTGVKQIFTNEEMKALLARQDMLFSSANSINWGRLLPQIVYYFYSYFELLRQGEIKDFETKINLVVPTGNFGNILAAYYANQMGLPVNRFICASNANNVLTDFIRTGTYDKRRAFYATSSPSMDILVSSNLERLLYAMCGEDSDQIAAWMNSLSAAGEYHVSEAVMQKVQNSFFGGCCDDNDTAATIRNLFLQEGYLSDTHTAVAVDVYRQYVKETNDSATPTIIVSTASPYKFTDSVLGALEAVSQQDEYEKIARLEELSHTKAPAQLLNLREKPVRFSTAVARDEMAGFVKKAVNRDRG